MINKSELSRKSFTIIIYIGLNIIIKIDYHIN